MMDGDRSLVRAPFGMLLAGFFTPFQAASSFDVEFQSLLHGLRLAVQYSDHIWVELDPDVVPILTSAGWGSDVVCHTLSSIRLICKIFFFFRQIPNMSIE